MMTDALAFASDNILSSDYVVPVAGCAMILGIVVANVFSGIRNREIQSTERLAAIAKGVPVPPTLEELAVLHGKPSADMTRRRSNVRRGGIVLLGIAGGLAAFFTAMAEIFHTTALLSGVAAALIPLGIGIALLVDARIQTRELDEAAARSLPESSSLSL